MDIREIENIIDQEHDGHPVFNVSKEQAIYDLLTSFEEFCSSSVICSMLNPTAIGRITIYMDALNMALQWVEQKCDLDTSGILYTDISEERYKQCISLLTDYAYPYSVICSGYISFSRKRFSATVDNNVVTFSIAENQNNSVWSDILREVNESSLEELMGQINPIKIAQASDILQRNIKIEDGMLCYELSDSIITPFKEVAIEHWNATKTLPDTWEFDLFTLEEYKKVWVWLATLCYIHFFANLTTQDKLIKIRNSTIIQSKESIVNYIMSESGLAKECVETILNYITFDPTRKNAEIMYQPIVAFEKDMLVIAPMLIIGSRPERNLLAVVISKSDKEHFKEVNDLEDLMVQELENVIPKTDGICIIKRKKLGGQLPDIDFAILDRNSNALLFCELKWFIAADSTKEVYAREDEITHGCSQVESIMAYALGDKKRFFNQIFGNSEDGENIDLFCCVVARHNIRTQHKFVPVIDLNRIKELFLTYSVNDVFYIIRNHKYELALPDDAAITHQEVKYGDYIFKIPAICFGTDPQ